jgi:hypothetical protein
MLTLITLNGVYALLDVVIINPTQTNFDSWVATSWRMATMMMGYTMIVISKIYLSFLA